MDVIPYLHRLVFCQVDDRFAGLLICKYRMVHEVSNLRTLRFASGLEFRQRRDVLHGIAGRQEIGRPIPFFFCIDGDCVVRRHAMLPTHRRSYDARASEEKSAGTPHKTIGHLFDRNYTPCAATVLRLRIGQLGNADTPSSSMRARALRVAQ